MQDAKLENTRSVVQHWLGKLTLVQVHNVKRARNKLTIETLGTL